MIDTANRVQLEVALNNPLSMGVPAIIVGTVESLDGLIAGDHYQVNEPSGTVTLNHVPAGMTHTSFRYRYLAPDPVVLAPVDYGTDAADTGDRPAIITAVQQLRAYIGLASPTGPQTVGALKLLIRLNLAFLKQRLG